MLTYRSCRSNDGRRSAYTARAPSPAPDVIGAVIRLTRGNFRLLVRLLTQMERVLAINGLETLSVNPVTDWTCPMNNPVENNPVAPALIAKKSLKSLDAFDKPY
jgi:hypothetical protein